MTSLILKAILKIAIFGLLIFVLWNWLMPVIFHLPEINAWQGMGLFVMSNILLKSTSTS